MRLIIVRHGQSTGNEMEICHGQTQHPLSKKGQEQVKKLGFRLKDEPIDIIYTSDLKRAMQTTEAIAKYHPNIKIIKDKRIREFRLGEWDGKPHPPEWDWFNLGPGSESVDSMCNRTKEFLDEIYKKHKNQTVLVSTHGGVKRAFFTIINKKPISEFASFPHSKNTCVSLLDIKEDGNHKIILMQCAKHLETDLQSH